MIINLKTIALVLFALQITQSEEINSLNKIKKRLLEKIDTNAKDVVESRILKSLKNINSSSNIYKKSEPEDEDSTKSDFSTEKPCSTEHLSLTRAMRKKPPKSKKKNDAPFPMVNLLNSFTGGFFSDEDEDSEEKKQKYFTEREEEMREEIENDEDDYLDYSSDKMPDFRKINGDIVHKTLGTLTEVFFDEDDMAEKAAKVLPSLVAGPTKALIGQGVDAVFQAFLPPKQYEKPKYEESKSMYPIIMYKKYFSPLLHFLATMFKKVLKIWLHVNVGPLHFFGSSHFFRNGGSKGNLLGMFRSSHHNWNKNSTNGIEGSKGFLRSLMSTEDINSESDLGEIRNNLDDKNGMAMENQNFRTKKHYSLGQEPNKFIKVKPIQNTGPTGSNVYICLWGTCNYRTRGLWNEYHEAPSKKNLKDELSKRAEIPETTLEDKETKREELEEKKSSEDNDSIPKFSD